MKKAILIALLLGFMFPVTGWAQGKFGATPEDSTICVEGLSIYKDFLKAKDYKKARSIWLNPYTVCPKSSKKMYIDGVKIYKGLIDENKENKELKYALVDSMLAIHDQRIENLGQEGYVLGRKGGLMLKYKRPSLQAAHETLKKSVELQGEKSEAAVLQYYFQSAVKINKETPFTPEQWVALFDQCIAIVDHNLSSTKDPKKIERYSKAYQKIVTMAEPYLTCENLILFFGNKYEEKKVDGDWLKNSAKLLEQKGCADDPLFFNIANQLHSLSPSAASARNMGVMSMKKKQYSKASEFFAQAIDLADDDEDDENLESELADLELWLAKSHYGAKQYSASRTHAQKAAGYKSNWGEPYMLIGDLYAGSVSLCKEGPDGALKTPYWAAVDMYAKAKAVDATVAQDATMKIAKYSQYFPSKQDAFFHNITEGSTHTIGCWINLPTKVRLQ